MLVHRLKEEFRAHHPQLLVKEACRAGHGLGLPNRTIKMGMGKIGMKGSTTCNDADLEVEAKFA